MIYILSPSESHEPLAYMLETIAHSSIHVSIHHTYDPVMKGQKVLFCFELDAFGDSEGVYPLVKDALIEDNSAFEGVLAALIVVSKTEFYTKRFAQSFIFNLSKHGVSFIGHPLLEIIEGYKNLRTWQKSIQRTLPQISVQLINQLLERFEHEAHKLYTSPKILVLHASQDATSNTLMLWNEVSSHLQHVSTRVLHVENGTIVDCKGCGFTQCIHYSEKNACFYGGQVILEILPAIEEADIVIWLLPNYNDAISAMLTAIINRMTVLYRRVALHEKTMFAIVVSGNSGGDSVANQLLGALNINKGLFLPQNFLLSAIANDPGTVLEIESIKEQAEAFANQIKRMIR